MFDILSSQRVNQLARFIIGGGINTSFTYSIYLSLSIFLNYQWAFFISYFLGVIIAYWFNSTIVFRAHLSWKGLFTYPVIYLIQYTFSAILLSTLVELGGISKTLAPLWVTAIMLPITFLLNKFILEWIPFRKLKKEEIVGSR